MSNGEFQFKKLNIDWDKYSQVITPETTPLEKIGEIAQTKLAGADIGKLGPKGKMLAEKWAMSDNAVLRGLGKQTLRIGYWAIPMYPLALLGSVKTGVLKELVRIGETPGRRILEQVPTEEWEQAVKVGALRPRKEWEELKKRAPLYREEPKGFIKSIGEAVGNAEWLYDLVKGLGASESTAAVLGLMAEFQTDIEGKLISKVGTSYKAMKMLKSLSKPHVRKAMFEGAKNKALIEIIQRIGKHDYDEFLKGYQAYIDVYGQDTLKMANITAKELAELNLIQQFSPDIGLGLERLHSGYWHGIDLNNRLFKTLNKFDDELAKFSTQIGLTGVANRLKQTKPVQWWREWFVPMQTVSDKGMREVGRWYGKYPYTTTKSLYAEIMPTTKNIQRVVEAGQEDPFKIVFYFDGTIKHYLKNDLGWVDDLAINNEILRLENTYKLKDIRNYWSRIADIDEFAGNQYSRINRYITILFDQKYGRGKFMYYSPPKKAGFMRHRKYDTLYMAWKAGEPIITDIDEIVRVRTYSTARAAFHNKLVQTFVESVGSAHPQEGYMKVHSYMAKKMGKQYLPQSIAELLNYERELLSPGKVMEQIMQGEKSLLNFWKTTVTLRSPMFHGTNLFGGISYNYLQSGLDATKPKWLITAAKMYEGKGLDKTIKTLDGQEVSLRFLHWMATTLGTPEGWVRSLIYRDDMAGIIGPAGAWLGNRIEGTLRFESFILNFRKYGDPFMADLMTKAHHFDYNWLTFYEREYIQKYFPFYTFWKNSLGLTMEQMLINPSPYKKMFNIFRAANELDPNDYRNRPEWMMYSPHIRLPFFNVGDIITKGAKPKISYEGEHPLYLALPFLPTQAAVELGKMTKFFDVTQPKKERWFALFGTPLNLLYPHYQAGLEYMFNWDMFRGRPIETDYMKMTKNQQVPANNCIWVKYLPKPLKKIMNVEEKIVKGKKTVMMNCWYYHMLHKLPMFYQVRLLFTSQMYGDYEEKQKIWDVIKNLTGIANVRAVNKRFYYSLYLRQQAARRKQEKEYIETQQEWSVPIR